MLLALGAAAGAARADPLPGREALEAAARAGHRAGWLGLAHRHEAAGEASRAAAALALGVATGALDRPEDLRALAARYRQAGLHRRAAQVLADGIAEGILPDDADTWAAVGGAREAAADPRGALAAYRRAVARGAEPGLLTRAARALAARHDWPRAAEAAEAALAAAPGDGAAWLVLGIARLRQGEDAAARKALEQALALPGGEPAQGWLEHLGGPP